ncbi:hypothetical protein ACLESO_54270 [Pyxidicoccus sp. 3LG]
MTAICAGGLVLGCQSQLARGPVSDAVAVAGGESSTRTGSEGGSRAALLVTVALGLATALGLYARQQTPRRAWAAPDLARAARLSHEYLRMRLHQLREDIARGMGPAVEESRAW